MLSWVIIVSLPLCLILAPTKGNLYEGHSLRRPCLPGHPCTLAFVSDNPVILRCPHAFQRVYVSWQYLDPAWTNEQPATFLHASSSFHFQFKQPKLGRLHLKSRLVAGNLYIPSPSVEDSGLYICRVGDAILAYYQVDFQDAEHIHVSHAGLEETILGNTTVELENGAQALLFTSWGPWQLCDRCGSPGERKQVGFCYAQVTRKKRQLEKMLPCGMARKKHPTLPQRGPELRLETCQVHCDESYALAKEEPGMVPLLVFTSYHPQLQATAYLRCPTSSIYSPVYWQEGPTALTRLELLQKNNSQSLDNATGGGILRLSFPNDTHSKVYQCYVNGHLVGKFLVTSPSTLPPAGELVHTYSIIEALVVGLSMFLVFLMFLSIIQSCRKKPGTTMV